MSYEVDGVDVGGPKPAWADGKNYVLPQDVKTVVYPNDVRITDGQHNGLISADSAAQGGVVNDNGELGLFIPLAPPVGAESGDEQASDSAPATGETPAEDPAVTPETAPAAPDTPSAGDSEPPVVESASDSAA